MGAFVCRFSSTFASLRFDTAGMDGKRVDKLVVKPGVVIRKRKRGRAGNGGGLPDCVVVLIRSAFRQAIYSPQLRVEVVEDGLHRVHDEHRFGFAEQGRQMPSEDKGYAERALIYAGDAHLQAVLDEYMYLLRHASQADTVEKALTQIGDVWKLSRGNPRTNGPKGYGSNVCVEENAEVHATHFALAFGEDASRDAGPGTDEAKMRKSVVREAFNSPFWPTQSLDEFQNRACFRFDDAFHQHVSGGVTDRNRDACLMHVHANILSVVHLGAPFRRS